MAEAIAPKRQRLTLETEEQVVVRDLGHRSDPTDGDPSLGGERGEKRACHGPSSSADQRSQRECQRTRLL